MPNPGRSSANPWLVLLLAGGFEIGYALSVGGSHGFTRLTWSLVAVVFFLLTLWALSVALRSIDVGIGYAVWAGIGSAGAALLGPVFFDQTLTLVKALWLSVIIVGVVWLKLADRPRKTPQPAEAPQAAQGIPASPQTAFAVPVGNGHAPE
ncbi:MAG TPA: multidrug efflux SMR transporter [Actinocrinis sp.]|nr:multidrug efflux SMR transporter [Actinocrinis sp.]